MSYGISPSDRLQTKRIAGKIIPAMATSTAAISGLVRSNQDFSIPHFTQVSIEMIKVLIGIQDLEKYKNAWMNLGELISPYFHISLTISPPHGDALGTPELPTTEDY